MFTIWCGCNTYNVGKLSLCDQVLSLSSHKFLLKSDKSGTGRFLVLELGNLITDLRFVVAAGLYTTLGVSDLLQDTSVVLQVLRIEVLLFTDLGHQHADLVGQVGDGVIVGRLAPVRELRRDRDTFPTSGLVGTDSVVLGLDELEQLLGQVRLSHATECAHGEGMLGRLLAGIFAALASYRQCSVHGNGLVVDLDGVGQGCLTNSRGLSLVCRYM